MRDSDGSKLSSNVRLPLFKIGVEKGNILAAAAKIVKPTRRFVRLVNRTHSVSTAVLPLEHHFCLDLPHDFLPFR